MEFWDSSAVVQLLVKQDQTELLKKRLESGLTPWVWWGTDIECASALSRLHREDKLTDKEFESALKTLSAYCAAWNEVLPTLVIKKYARRLLKIHPLRAADSLQLAAAITASNNDPTNISFITFDERLNIAANKEGFLILTRN